MAMSARLRIAIDAMGGDHGLRAVVPAAKSALLSTPHLEIVLVGHRAAIEAELRPFLDPRLSIVHAESHVAMDESPAEALRQKRDSSMGIALQLLQQRRVDAVVSAGNTGALVGMARHLLETLPGVRRPAICAPMPGQDGPVYMLDLGANVDCAAHDLHRFASMGSALAAVLDSGKEPRVALLNIGEELIKGNEQVRFAAELIGEDPGLNYVGFVEGHEIFSNKADVIVCDGFVGNVALKVSEGTAAFVGKRINRDVGGVLATRLGKWLFSALVNKLYKRIDPSHYNGAALLGLDGVVVKAHGDSTALSFQYAINHARVAAEQKLPQRVAEYLDKKQKELIEQ